MLFIGGVEMRPLSVLFLKPIGLARECHFHWRLDENYLRPIKVNASQWSIVGNYLKPIRGDLRENSVQIIREMVRGMGLNTREHKIAFLFYQG